MCLAPGSSWRALHSGHTSPMAVTVADMARTWQRRLGERQARADARAERLRRLLPAHVTCWSTSTAPEGSGYSAPWPATASPRTATSTCDRGPRRIALLRRAGRSDGALWRARRSGPRRVRGRFTQGQDLGRRPARMSPRIRRLRAEIASDLTAYASLVEELAGLPCRRVLPRGPSAGCSASDTSSDTPMPSIWTVRPICARHTWPRRAVVTRRCTTRWSRCWRWTRTRRACSRRRPCCSLTPRCRRAWKASALDRTRSRRESAPAGWVRSTAPATRS